VHRRPELVRALASAAARRVRAREVGERYFAGQTLAECVAAAAALGLPEQAAWERLHLEVVAKARIPDLPDLLEGVAEAGARSEDGAVVRARLGRLADAVKVIFHGPRTASLLTIGRCDPPWLLASVEALLGP
jgi:hypothetical protein